MSKNQQPACAEMLNFHGIRTVVKIINPKNQDFITVARLLQYLEMCNEGYGLDGRKEAAAACLQHKRLKPEGRVWRARIEFRNIEILEYRVSKNKKGFKNEPNLFKEVNMKKLFAVLVVVLVLIGTGAALAAIVNTKHDLSAAGVANNEVCVWCHTPHNSDTTQLAPLWSHQSTGVNNYVTYNSATLDGTVSQPSGVTKACLSCHDGTVAVGNIAYGRYAGNLDPGAHGGATDYAANEVMTGGALLGTDLSNDHPVSITYNNAADSGLRAPTGGQVTDGTITLQLYGTSNNMVECASCHNVHDDTNSPFLRASNSGSALCLVCHLK